MRLAGAILALVLGVGGSARADVFVPADPPPLRSAYCTASAGDFVVAGEGGAAKPVLLSLMGAAWRPLPRLNGCPVTAAAADGTAVIAGAGAAVVRGPSGTFGAPVALGSELVVAPAVAAAPGGWGAIAWPDYESRTLNVMIVRPDGTTSRGVLDRDVSFDLVQVGVDAGGNATIAWSRPVGQRVTVRTARFAAGGTPVTGAELADAVGPFALAVAPGGGTLIAWGTADSGVRAVVDGALVTVDPVTYARRLTASVTDDGAAVIAYAGAGSEIIVSDRGARGAWSVPRVVSGSQLEVTPESVQADAEEDLGMRSVLDSHGRAVVVWPAWSGGERGIVAASGVAGGDWGRAARLSSFTRSAGSAGLALDGAGVARVGWIEPGRGAFGAVLSGAGLSDTTAPRVTVAFPSRLPPTRTGRVTVAVRVRCSEACDARLAFGGATVARALGAGRSVTLRLAGSPSLQHDLLRDSRSRRQRLQLLVTDRAGNLVRRSAVLRIRVLERPVRALVVALEHDFKMASAAGDAAVARLVNGLISAVAGDDSVSEETLRRRLNAGLARIRRDGHPEVARESVRAEIRRVLDVPLARTGHDVDELFFGD